MRGRALRKGGRDPILRRTSDRDSPFALAWIPCVSPHYPRGWFGLAGLSRSRRDRPRFLECLLTIGAPAQCLNLGDESTRNRTPSALPAVSCVSRAAETCCGKNNRSAVAKAT